MGTSVSGSGSEVIEWQPARLLATDIATGPHAERPSPAFALLVLNQPLRNLPVVKKLWKNASAHFAADGGANRIYEAMSVVVVDDDDDQDFYHLQAIIGDLDSLRDDVRAFFVSGPAQTQFIYDSSVYSTDFGKAVGYIRHQHQSISPQSLDIVALGGLGGRVDQGLSQLHHLHLFQKDPAYTAGRMYLVSEESITFLLKTGRHRIWVREEASGDDVFAKYVGIVPVKEPSVITTRGLKWDVQDWKTEIGGQVSTSNHVLPDTRVVEVETTADVLFTIALRETG